MASVSFWHHIAQPIIGLSPMDGVTDPAFRFIVAKYGRPDVQVTEFINVDEVCHGGEASWSQLHYAEIERPVVAQIYGADPDKFYQVAQVVCELGFDGVDIIPELVESANAYAVGYQLPATFMCQDITELRLRPNSYDCALFTLRLYEQLAVTRATRSGACDTSDDPASEVAIMSGSWALSQTFANGIRTDEPCVGDTRAD